MRRSNFDDVQGYFLKIPYDFRKPTLARFFRRVFNPGGGVLSPKVFGWGYTINFANKNSWIILGVLIGIGLLCVLVSALS